MITNNSINYALYLQTQRYEEYSEEVEEFLREIRELNLGVVPIQKTKRYKQYLALLKKKEDVNKKYGTIF